MFANYLKLAWKVMLRRRFFTFAAVLPDHLLVTLDQLGHLQLQTIDHPPLLDHHIIELLQRVILKRLTGFQVDDLRFQRHQLTPP